MTEPLDDARPVAWRITCGKKMYVGMITADPKVRDVWLEAEMEVETLYAAPARCDAGSGDADSSWSKIDSELSAYVQVVRADLIDKCAKEAERCDTHALFCMADPRSIRSDIADRIRALSTDPGTVAVASGERERPPFCATADSICHHPACSCARWPEDDAALSSTDRETP